jgi:4-amino-4-deoxy-L-arabinose transferase-like glycosyltransferase
MKFLHNFQPNSLRRYGPIIIILALAAVLRIMALIYYGDFWRDEMFSVVYSQKTWLESIKFWLWETNPPLHMFILKLWFYIFPATELFARLPSMIFGMLSVCFIYRFSSKIFNHSTGILASFFLALSPYHVYLSSTARGYSLLIMLAILSAEYFYRYLTNDEKKYKYLIILAVVNFLMLFTHLTALFFIAGQCLVLLGWHAKNSKQYIFSTLPAGIIWVVWELFSFLQKKDISGIAEAWYFRRGNIIDSLKDLVFGTVHPLWSVFLFYLLICALVLTVYNAQRKNKLDSRILQIIILALFIIMLPLAFGTTNINFITTSLPLIAIIAAWTLGQIFKKIIWSILLILILTVPGLMILYDNLPTSNWGLVNAYINRQVVPGQRQIFIFENFMEKPVFDKYYRAQIPSLAYNQYENENWDYSLITKNFLVAPRTEEELLEWLKNKQINSYQEILVLHDSTYCVSLHYALKKLGWGLKDQPFSASLYLNPIILKYVKR